MMKQLTGAQPVKEANNNSPTKRTSPRQAKEESKGKNRNKDQAAENNQESPDFIRNQRIENIKKRAEDSAERRNFQDE